MHKTDLRKIELRIAYVGSQYFGWQIQSNNITVQELLQNALRRTLAEPKLKTMGASRTDTGVHAHDNRVHFITSNPIPLGGLMRALNHLLPDDISILTAEERPLSFSVRHHARAKHYSYLFYNGTKATPFIAPYMWRYKIAMNEEKMNTCAEFFEGTQCFKSLQAAADHRKETLTTIYKASVTRHDKLICFDVIGHSFLYHMVRNMAGSLLMVGTGEWSVEEFKSRFISGDRKMMGVTAPAQGLHLFRIFYSDPPHTFSEEKDAFLSRLTL